MKLIAHNVEEGVKMYGDADKLELHFPHGNQEFTVNYKVVEGELVQVLAVRNLTKNCDVERGSAVWDNVVMDTLELHALLVLKTPTEYYNVPVVRGTFSHY